jgi:prepilin-type N-terminal cleavage/methylation domain-containing protein
MKGFTLIELLVVIAIIGILSSVVLASLNTARNKGADAAIKSNLAEARAQAELFYDANSNSYATVCDSGATAGGVKGIYASLQAAQTAAGAANLVSAIGTAGAAGAVTCHANAAGWAAESPLKTTGAGFYCVDSTGAALTKTSGSALAASAVICS